MKQQFIVLLCCLALFGMAACVSDAEEDIIPTTGGGTGTGGGGSTTCDTTGVTFSGTVQPLIQSNCLPCHSNSNLAGGIDLEGYSDIRTQALNGKLEGVITHTAGFPAMPQGSPKLPSCDIDKIVKWIDDGAPQN